MKKLLVTILVLTVFFCFSASAWAADFEIDTSRADEGLLVVKNIQDIGKRMRLQIALGTEKYVYEIRPDKEQEAYPLQMGNGNYKATILENIADTRYRVVKSQEFEVNIPDSNQVFLHSIQPVFWQTDMAPVKYAQGMLNGDETKLEQIKTIYQHMIKNYRYNWAVFNKLPSTYVPDIEVMYKDKTGICYDYSALAASMLRSMGYPTRLVKGYSAKVEGYHAWNEVLINQEWVIIDTTLDSSSKAPVFRKSAKDYTGTGIY